MSDIQQALETIFSADSALYQRRGRPTLSVRWSAAASNRNAATSQPTRGCRGWRSRSRRRRPGRSEMTP